MDQICFCHLSRQEHCVLLVVAFSLWQKTTVRPLFDMMLPVGTILTFQYSILMPVDLGLMWGDPLLIVPENSLALKT